MTRVKIPDHTRVCGEILKALTLAFSLGVAAACSHHPGARQAPSKTTASAIALTRTYVEDWRRTLRKAADIDRAAFVYNAWGLQRTGEGLRTPMRSQADSILVHTSMRAMCEDEGNHSSGFTDGSEGEGASFNSRYTREMRDQLASLRVPRTGLAGSCPFWTDRATVGQSATESIEAMFAPQLRRDIEAKRTALVRALDSLSRNDPADAIAIGQTVRFALAGNDKSTAREAALRCAADEILCLRLRALSLLSEGRGLSADSVFRHARDLERAHGMCDDASRMLLSRPPEVIGGCENAVAREEWLWWLSNPMWSNSFNARRIAHEQRRTEVTLRKQVGADEFFDFGEEDAPATALVLRFGWPTTMALVDTGAQKAYLRVRPYKDVPHRQVGAPNYSRDRFATVPSAGVIESPFTAVGHDWPQGWSSSRDPLWAPWPWEHARMRPLLRAMPHYQSARFVREARLRFVIAAPEPRTPDGDVSRTRSTLMWSTHPDTIRSLGEAPSQSDGSLRVVGNAPLGRSVLSLETRPVDNDSNEVAWRVRFGQVPTDGLRAAIQDNAGISDILLFDPLDPSNLVTPSLEKATRTMFTSSTLPPSARVGVFWEVYASPEADSISYKLTVTGKKGAVLARLLSAAIGRTANSDGIAVSWTQSGAGSNVQRMTDASRGIFPTAMSLNLSQPEPGEYTIRVDATLYQGTSSRVISTAAPLLKP